MTAIIISLDYALNTSSNSYYNNNLMLLQWKFPKDELETYSVAKRWVKQSIDTLDQ